jgi:hypothetical protein
LLVGGEESFAVAAEEEGKAVNVGVQFGQFVAGGADEASERGCEEVGVLAVEPVAEEGKRRRLGPGVRAWRPP